MSNFSIFSERKAAEAAAFLLLKGGGGLELLKLMKLMYLAERESFKKYGESITGDAFVSMQHGPVLSGTYDFAKAHSRVALAIGAKQEGYWRKLINFRAGNLLTINPKAGIANPDEDLLGLSDSDVECLEAAWKQFGHLSAGQLVDFTHENCGEWDKHVGGSSSLIPVARMLKEFGYQPEHVHAIDRRIHEQRYLSNALSS